MPPRARLPLNRRALALSAAGGVVFALTAPPLDLYPAVIVGLGALYLALTTAPSAKSAAGRAWLWASAAQVVGLRFVPVVVDNFTPVGLAGGIAALILLAAFQALGWALGGALFSLLATRARLASPVAFGAAVLLSVSVPAVFGWSPASVVSPWPELIQLADLVGERGVSFLLAVAAALLATPLCLRGARRAWLAAAAGAGLLGLVGLYGALRLRQVRSALAERPTLSLAVIQPAVPARLRWERGARDEILGRLRQLTMQAEAEAPELVLWPEAAYPYLLPHAAGPMPRGRRAIVGRGVRGPVLFGALTRSLTERGQHNSATIVDAAGQMQAPQAKLELLWFGETIPFGKQLPWLRRLFFRAGGLIAGEEVVLLEHAGARIGILNCYEDILPGVGRKVARAAPDLLVNVTNDAWFGETIEGELHLRLSVLRAVEARLDMVRAVNFGVPAWIDASGSVRTRGPAAVAGVMLATPAISTATNGMSPTLYTKAGDYPLWLGLVIATGGAWLGARRRARGRKITEPDL